MDADKLDTLTVFRVEGRSDAATIAETAFSSIASGAATARTFMAGTFGKLDVNDCVGVLKQRIEGIHAGDLKHAETTLTAQAATLDAIFNEMARRAAWNMGAHLDATERYMRLALKAQGQCRATLETLAAIKNPPVIFAKQANIAQGPQQVNNGVAAGAAVATPARAEETMHRQNELLEDARHGGTNLDTGAAPAATRSHQALEAVGAVHRTKKRRG